MRSKQEGFTLVELLLVISIIGILSAIAMTSLNGARHKARVAIVLTNMSNFADAVYVARGVTGLYLMDITGSDWTERSCCNSWAGGCTPRDLRKVPESDQCYKDWVNVLNKIDVATDGSITGLVHAMARDPWGSPYLLDENEGEVKEDGNICDPDQFRSVGPDGLGYTEDDLLYFLQNDECNNPT